MRRLLDFLLKYNYWFLFVFLEVTSFVLLFKFNNFQRNVILAFTDEVTGWIYEVRGGVTGYFNLKDINEELFRRNAELERRAVYYEAKIKELVNDSARFDVLQQLGDGSYQIYPAWVINRSLNKEDNYLTLNRGSKDGIMPDMGVVDVNGVVGIVYRVSENYAVVISLLNSKSNLSCKVKGTEYFGYLKWEGKDSQFAYLKDVPRHAEFTLGDTIVTSGFSTVFPEGLMVGMVDDIADSNDGLSFQLKIKLAANFAALREVGVLDSRGKSERDKLEKDLGGGTNQ